jgi:hypothetical protein
MSAQPDLSKLSVGQFAERFRDAMIPLSNTFSYFCASVPLSEEDVKEYLEEPIAALPPAISALLPKVSIMLVPYLERADGKEKGTIRRDEFVVTEKPPDSRASWATQVRFDKEEVLVFALKDQDVSEYHYRFYHVLATLAADHGSDEALLQYSSLLREEMNARVHGEVDEESWHMKQALLRRETNVRKETKPFRDYVRQSLLRHRRGNRPAPVAQPPYAQAAQPAVQFISPARRLRRFSRASGTRPLVYESLQHREKRSGGAKRSKLHGV